MLKQFAKQSLDFACATFGPHRWPQRKPSCLVLTYHRVLPRTTAAYQSEQPGMLVTPETLDQHLKWLREAGYTIVSVNDWLAAVAAGNIPWKKACAITFDDGWRDNYEHAFPVLLRHNAPFSIYVVSNLIKHGSDFWPGQLVALLEHALSENIDLVSRSCCQWLLTLPNIQLPAKLPLTPDEIDKIVEACKILSDAEIYEHLRKWQLSVDYDMESAPVNLLGEAEIRTMLESRLLTLGSHTCNHTRLLPTLGSAQLALEIVDSRRALESWFGGEVGVFCYPNGDFTPHAKQMVAENYRGALTCINGVNTGDTDPFLLKRISMHEDATANANGFWARVSGWR